MVSVAKMPFYLSSPILHTVSGLALGLDRRGALLLACGTCPAGASPRRNRPRGRRTPGPSTHVKRVLPPTVTRQAPHMPVPSTISALSDTVVFSAYFFVVRATNFIIIIGPMATHSS